MNIDSLFNNLDSSDSYAILFITIIGFLFGLLVGILLKGAKARSYRKLLKAETKKLQEIETEKITLEGKLLKKKEALNDKEEEIRALIERIEALDLEKQNVHTKEGGLQEVIEQLQASNQSYASTVEDLHNQVIGLTTKNEQLLEEINNQEAYATQTPTLADDDTLDRLNAVEEQLSAMSAQNQELQGLLQEFNSNNAKAPKGGNMATAEPSLDDLTPKGKDILQGRIIERPDHVDDLTKIEGLGSFTEKKLNSVGIFTYEQISGWSEDMVEHITEEIEFIPGRIQKDQWIEQATELLQGHKVKSKLPKKYQDPTNLTVIEGIGPKIEELFKADGINNWTDLSASSKKRLDGILEKAGKRFQMHDPTTWSKQATLAANSKWKQLEKYQDDLKGGR